MSVYPDPQKIEQKIFNQDKKEMNKDDPLRITINSVRGRVADGVTTLTGRLLEKEKEVPEELCKLLEHFAKGPSGSSENPCPEITSIFGI